MLRTILREPNLASFNRKYAVGISYDLLEDCWRVAKIQQDKHYSFTLLLGEKDRMFPPKEVLAALNAAGLASVATEVMPGIGHASLAVRSSRIVLRRAIAAARRGELIITRPTSATELSKRISRHIKPGIKPQASANEYYQANRKADA